MISLVPRPQDEHSCKLCGIQHTVSTAAGWKCLNCGAFEASASGQIGYDVEMLSRLKEGSGS